MKTRTERRALQAQQQAAFWNNLHPVGTPVRYWPGAREGQGQVGRTRSRAWELCGSAVVQVTGKAGGIALTHVAACSYFGKCNSSGCPLHGPLTDAEAAGLREGGEL